MSSPTVPIQQTWPSEVLLSEFLVDSDTLIRCDSPKVQPSTMHRESACSSLGRLETLPRELLLHTLGLLDFQSLSRLSRTSLKGKAAVEGLPAYKDVMKHAPMALTALSNTRLLKYHSSALLRHALRSNRCASCFEWAGYLYLPTCERVCHRCPFKNYALRMMSLPTAKQFFALTDGQLETVPVLHGVREHHQPWLGMEHQQLHYRLVSVKQVKRLAIEVHGSMENVAKVAVRPLDEPDEPQFPKTHFFDAFHAVSLEPLGQNWLKIPRPEDSIVSDAFGGTSSIRFPYLDAGERDYGRQCLGCLVFSSCLEPLEPAYTELMELAYPGIDPDRMRDVMGTWLRPTRDDTLLEHVRQCYAVHHVVMSAEAMIESE